MTQKTDSCIKNAYIHIPFCKNGKCNYCSFVSVPDLKLKEAYLISLKKQISNEYKDEPLETLYIGGGTPSVLSADEVQSLINKFNFEDNPEITMELNPDNATLEYLQALKALGINRLSIGAQTFDDAILKIIGRRHDSKQIEQALEYAIKAGFENISLDLIYGLPMQSIEDFLADLKKAISFPIKHISLYGLKIEEGTYFYKRKPKNIANLDIQADMYLKAIDFLEKNGFEHYEISNFVKPGYYSKHNLSYWNNKNYYGFGCSASGYIEKTRYQMQPLLKKYIENPMQRDFEQTLTEEEILEEAIFLGFRKKTGIDINEINEKFCINFEEKYSKILEKYAEYFKKNEPNIALTNNGLLISNEILCNFIN